MRSVFTPPLPGAERITFFAPAARSRGLLVIVEQARRLDHVLGAELLPRELARVLGRHDAPHLVAADDEYVVRLGRGAALLR